MQNVYIWFIFICLLKHEIRLAWKIGSSLALFWFRKRAARAANNSHGCLTLTELELGTTSASACYVKHC